MKARSALMMALAEVIRERGMTQGEAAALFGVTQPRISDPMRGKINLFSLDTLIDMAATAGMSPMVKVSKPKVVRHKCKKASLRQRWLSKIILPLPTLRVIAKGEESDTFTDLA